MFHKVCIEFTTYCVVSFASSSVNQMAKISSALSPMENQYIDFVLLGIFWKVGGLSEAFETTESLGPFHWLDEIETF